MGGLATRESGYECSVLVPSSDARSPERSFLLLVVRSGTPRSDALVPSSVLVPSSKATSPERSVPSSLRTRVAMPLVPNVGIPKCPGSIWTSKDLPNKNMPNDLRPETNAPKQVKWDFCGVPVGGGFFVHEQCDSMDLIKSPVTKFAGFQWLHEPHAPGTRQTGSRDCGFHIVQMVEWTAQDGGMTLVSPPGAREGLPDSIYRHSSPLVFGSPHVRDRSMSNTSQAFTLSRT